MPIRARYKIIPYVAAWVAALFAVEFNFGGWTLAWMFPLGLAAVINRHWANDGGWGVFAASYGIYLVHAYFYFCSRTTRSALFWFAILIILFVGNVAGCREMIHPH